MAHAIIIVCDACGHEERAAYQSVRGAEEWHIEHEGWQRVTYTYAHEENDGNPWAFHELRCPACRLTPVSHQQDHTAAAD